MPEPHFTPPIYSPPHHTAQDLTRLTEPIRSAPALSPAGGRRRPGGARLSFRRCAGGVIASEVPSIVERRCKRCGRFKSQSNAELCLRCLAVMSIARGAGDCRRKWDGSMMTGYRRFRADLGLDTSLQQDTRNREFSGPLDPDAVGVARGATSGGLTNGVQPPLSAFLNSPSRPRIETVLPRSPRPLSTPARGRCQQVFAHTHWTRCDGATCEGATGNRKGSTTLVRRTTGSVAESRSGSW